MTSISTHSPIRKRLFADTATSELQKIDTQEDSGLKNTIQKTTQVLDQRIDLPLPSTSLTNRVSSAFDASSHPRKKSKIPLPNSRSLPTFPAGRTVVFSSSPSSKPEGLLPL